MIPFSARLPLAFKAFFSILFAGRWPAEAITASSQPDVPQPPSREAPAEATAMQLLAVLQRDGRLVDFLMEDLAPYGDAQVGAAVRDVHAGCRHALQSYLTMGPVLSGVEGDRVTIEPGTDAGSVRVIGNVKGHPPFQGVLKHRGWVVQRLALPAIPAADHAVVAPAEVEVS
jgi:hypothetical protein